MGQKCDDLHKSGNGLKTVTAAEVILGNVPAVTAMTNESVENSR